MLLAPAGDPKKAAYSQTATLPLRPASRDTWTIAALLVMYKPFGLNGKKRAQTTGILAREAAIRTLSTVRQWQILELKCPERHFGAQVPATRTQRSPNK